MDVMKEAADQLFRKYMQEQDERQLQDNDYEYAYRTVQSWLEEAEMRTMYPTELAALKFLLGRTFWE